MGRGGVTIDVRIGLLQLECVSFTSSSNPFDNMSALENWKGSGMGKGKRGSRVDYLFECVAFISSCSPFDYVSFLEIWKRKRLK